MTRIGHFTVLVIALVGTAVATPNLWAATGAPLAQEVGRELAGPVRTGEHVVVPRLVLDNGSTISLDLEAFDVFAPATNIVEFTDQGPRRLAPPTDRYFRGSVVGDLDSLVVLASGATVRGFIYTNGALYAIAPDHNVYGNARVGSVSRIRRVDPVRDRPAGMEPFRCDAGTLPIPPPDGMSASGLGTHISVQPLWTSTVYTVTLAIETDYEFFQKFGSTTGELQYIGDLTAAASAIYQRDVKTTFQLGTVHVYSTAADPWSATTTSTALTELQNYWNTNYTSVSRTIVHMLSGKNMGGGIAYLGVLCNASYGYGVSASLAGTFSTSNPSLYWDILCYTHEIGHNFDSPHTECYSPPIDTCTACDSTTCSGSVPAGGGTIMSYCHLCSGGYSNLILYFGLAGQASQAVIDRMRGFVESQAACLLVTGSAPSVSAVAPSTGSVSGGTGITVSGSGFQSGAVVKVGGVLATGVVVGGVGTITATTPAHTAGVVDVVVTNPDAQSGALAGGFTYASVGPAMSVSRPALYFGATNGGAIMTSGQAVAVSFAGGVVVAWTATPNNSFIQVSAGSGAGTGTFTVSIAGGSYSAPSTLSGSVTVSAPGASNAPQTVAVTLKVYSSGATAAPFGVVDAPVEGTQGVVGSIGVTGWALDDVEVGRVEIWRDPVGTEPVGANGHVYIGVATFVSGARPDVEAAYPGVPWGYRAGWGYMLLTNMLPNGGNGAYRLYAYAVDVDGHQTLLGSRGIGVANATAVKPFGSIDTPGQGATVSGSAYVNFGWALTPQPGAIAVDGSTITVWIDGQPMGHPVYNNYRSDIATLFPGLANTGGAVGYYVIDTTALANGMHNIAWSVTDNLGRTEGIGSRYLWVLN